jgi:hypothetical protein
MTSPTLLTRLKKWDTHLILVVLLTVFAIGPLFQPGFFWGAHDARHSVYFLYEFDRSIAEGILYPRWSPDITFGYGYPLFNIYSPLAFYMGEAFHLVGLDLLWAIKIVFAASFVLSGVCMYLFVTTSVTSTYVVPLPNLWPWSSSPSSCGLSTRPWSTLVRWPS